MTMSSQYNGKIGISEVYVNNANISLICFITLVDVLFRCVNAMTIVLFRIF